MSKIDSHFEASIQHREPSPVLYDDLEWWDEAGGVSGREPPEGGERERERERERYTHTLMAGFASLYDRKQCNIIK